MSREINNTLRYLRELVTAADVPVHHTVKAHGLANKLEAWCKANKIRVPKIKRKRGS